MGRQKQLIIVGKTRKLDMLFSRRLYSKSFTGSRCSKSFWD